MPQSLFETKPEVLRIIEAAERARPASGPFRIHRMPLWNPLGWHTTSSTDRVHDLVSWERDTLQPKYGINLGVEYTHTIGVAELYDYEWYFSRLSAEGPHRGDRRVTGRRGGKGGGLFPSPGFRHVEHPVLRLAVVPRRLERRKSRVRLFRVPDRADLSRSRAIPRARGKR